MHGQWWGEIAGEFSGELRVELEYRGSIWFGHAYLFYDASHDLPGFLFELRVPKSPPHELDVHPVYLFSDGGVMSPENRAKAETQLVERFGQPPFAAPLHISLALDQGSLVASWTDQDGDTETLTLTPSLPSGPSDMTGRADLLTWDNFREWAVDQKPRKYIFRGQSKPHKLTSTFHRTWRKDLRSWINSDVNLLYGALAEKISYPLQLGKLDHNAALWNLLQHHGYPTPLIDWTFSPFVAAFFAFQSVTPDQTARPRIFIFDQEAWNARYGRMAFTADAARAQVIVLESISFGNPRASPQQALSTVVNVADVESFVAKQERSDGAEYLTACDLSPAEQPKIMRELELMGITYGSLFPGLDGICRDMKDRLFDPSSWRD